eukprot:gene15489-biopygen1992
MGTGIVSTGACWKGPGEPRASEVARDGGGCFFLPHWVDVETRQRDVRRGSAGTPLADDVETLGTRRNIFQPTDRLKSVFVSTGTRSAPFPRVPNGRFRKMFLRVSH